MEQASLMAFFETFIGEIPPEMIPLIYVFGIMVVLFIIDQFFTMLTCLFGVTKYGNRKADI